jgi:hypothetical protein
MYTIAYRNGRKSERQCRLSMYFSSSLIHDMIPGVHRMFGPQSGIGGPQNSAESPVLAAVPVSLPKQIEPELNPNDPRTNAVYY